MLGTAKPVSGAGNASQFGERERNALFNSTSTKARCSGGAFGKAERLAYDKSNCHNWAFGHCDRSLVVENAPGPQHYEARSHRQTFAVHQARKELAQKLPRSK